HGAGRVVHIAHEGVTTRAPGDGTGFGELTEATLGWLGGEAPVVGVGPGFDGLRNALAGRGYAVRPVVGPADLDGLDVFATTAYVEYDAAMRAAVEAFVAGGGALLSAGHAWWWAQGGGDVVNDFPGNRMLRPFGLTVLGETAAGGAYGVERFVDSELGQARCGLWALADEARGVAELAPAERTLAAAAAGGAVSVLPMDSPLFQAAVEISAQVGPVVPTPADPVVPAEQPLRALAVRVQVRQALDAPAEQVQAHPAGDDFPGAVDPDAPRVAFEINHLLRYAGYPAGYVAASAGAHLWLPTVMYAAPGEVISVRVPERVAGQGLAIQIGAHTDTLWHRDRWERMPAVTRRVPLSQPITSIATGFGGPVYLTVPPGTDLGEAVILFQGGVHMPLYQFPQDPAAFQAEVAATGAPWVDVMANQRVNLLLPTSVAREIVDPQALMAFWTDAMDTISGLDGVDPARDRTERFVFDRQISAGWMHSGYPIMAHLPSALEVSDLDALTTVGAWGPFHELGHNHQWVDWLLPGTGEASCNLWSVIASEAVAGVPRAAAHPELTPARRAQRLQAWRANPDPARWEVWTALETYLQLQEAFGWDWLTRTFQAYRALPAGQRPRDDAARRQLWIRQTSRAIGRDLTDFYRAWAFPVTPETAAAVADLPAWADHPMR
ncbi:MAG: M60 family metallopeptidase, partial [Myxococcales bacterium]|nr:M60 family metallopeptidase [Myxococcales bacterium]